MARGADDWCRAPGPRIKRATAASLGAVVYVAVVRSRVITMRAAVLSAVGIAAKEAHEPILLATGDHGKRAPQVTPGRLLATSPVTLPVLLTGADMSGV